jgi:hypothetical protein
MSGDTHTMTRHHFPGDFKSSVKNFTAQVCVAAGTSVCTSTAMYDSLLQNVHLKWYLRHDVGKEEHR